MGLKKLSCADVDVKGKRVLIRYCSISPPFYVLLELISMCQ